MNLELAKVKNWCHVNELYINITKTSYIIMKSSQKKDAIISMKLKNLDESFQLLERKQCIKYLGVKIDKHLTWKNQISFTRARISWSIEIIS